MQELGNLGRWGGKEEIANPKGIPLWGKKITSCVSSVIGGGRVSSFLSV
jgi:hypothetical protein